MKKEEEFKEIPYFSRYEISREGTLRNKETKNVIKSKKVVKAVSGKIYDIKLGENVKSVRPHILIFLTYNPYKVRNIDNYFKIKNNYLYFKDGDDRNYSIYNIGIKKEFEYLLVRGEEHIGETHKEYVEEYWDYRKNNREGIRLDEYTYGATKNVWWKCERGHSYKDNINRRLRSKGCKICKKFNRVSVPQNIVYSIIKDNFKKVKLEKSVGKYRVDIYIKDINLAVEYDGSAWHKSEERLIKDVEKEKEIKRVLGSKIVRIREEGCGVIETESEVYEYENKYSGDYDKLKEIVYKIVERYKGGKVVKKEYNEGEMINKIWNSEENSLIKNFPHLRKYFSNKNNILFEDLTYGSHYKIKWECYKCGFYWEQNINRLCKNEKGKYCPNCEKTIKKGKEYNKFILNKLNKDVYEQIGDEDKRNIKIKAQRRGKTGEQYKCRGCSKYIKNRNKDFCDRNCYEKHRRKEIPTKNELVRVLTEDPSFMSVGRKYGVSDNAVRKWCDKYNIPRRTNYWESISKKVKG